MPEYISILTSMFIINVSSIPFAIALLVFVNDKHHDIPVTFFGSTLLTGLTFVVSSIAILLFSMLIGYLTGINQDLIVKTASAYMLTIGASLLIPVRIWDKTIKFFTRSCVDIFCFVTIAPFVYYSLIYLIVKLDFIPVDWILDTYNYFVKPQI